MWTLSIIDQPFDVQDVNDETLYGTMDKTLCLLHMGFSENEVSLAIDKFGE